MAIANVRNVFPEKSKAECARIAKSGLTRFILTVLEFFGGRRFFAASKVTHVNIQSMQKALEQGRGVYALCLHMGNFELMVNQGTKFLAPSHGIAKPIGKGAVAEWVVEHRASYGAYVVKREKKGDAIKNVKLLLEQNCIIGFMGDQRRSKGMLLPFCGKPCMTNTSLFYLWKQHKAPIIPTMMRQVGLNSHEMIFEEEFLVLEHPDWSDEEFLKQNTLKMNQQIEKMIRMAPENYFWYHNRWKL